MVIKKLAVVAMLFMAVLVSGCSNLSQRSVAPVKDAPHIIYVVYRHWHTSIVLDANALARSNPELAPVLKGADFVRIGWGDGDYFTGKSKTWGSATKALLASGYSALQVLTYSQEALQEIPTDTQVPVAITEQGLGQLLAYITASIARDSAGNIIVLPASSSDGDNMDIGLFVKAHGHYNLFNNCNTWSGKALRQADLPVSRRLTAQGVFSQAQHIAQLQSQAGALNIPQESH